MYTALALVFFTAGIGLLFSYFSAPDTLLLLFAGIGCLWLGGYLWSRRQKDDDDAWWLDILDLVIEFPYRLLLNGVRLAGKSLDNWFDFS